VILVCLLPLLVLVILYKYNSMKQAMRVLQDQIHYYVSQSGTEENEGDQILEIHSDSKADKLKLRFRDIILIKSADNYFEVFYRENRLVERKLIRGTLTNIESQLAGRPEFLKCHRTCIANLDYVESMVRSYSGFGIKLRSLEEAVPVSRQHLTKVKNALASGD
jgi:DNA-binding LytR/AlgR family response regulator